MDDKGPLQKRDRTHHSANYQGRLPGLGATLLAAIRSWLHSGVPYLRTRMEALSWPTHDPHQVLVDALYWCEGFIMPLFFVLDGAAATLYAKKSSREFVADRTLRAGAARVAHLDLAMMLFIWSAGWVITWDTARKTAQLQLRR